MQGTFAKAAFALALPLGLAAGSWFLAGAEIWLWTALGSATLLVLAILGALRQVGWFGRREWLFVGYLLLTWASWWAPGFFFPHTTVSIKPWESSATEPDTPFQAVYGGQEVLSLDRFRECSFSFRGRFYPARLQLFTEGPQGPLKRTFRDYGTLSLEAIPTAPVYIDNTAPAPATLRCGRLTKTVEAGQHVSWVLPAPDGERQLLLLLDARGGGQADRSFVLEGKAALVDVTGSNTYRLRQLTYGGFIDQMAGTLRGPRVETLAPAHFHALEGKIDYFLTPAPESIKVQTLYGYAPAETHTELTRE